MESQCEKKPCQPSSSSGISFSFQKKASQSRVKLEAGASLGERLGGGVGEGKDYVLSMEGKTIHRLVAWYGMVCSAHQLYIPHNYKEMNCQLDPLPSHINS